MATKGPNTKLKAVRENYPYSQQEVADLVGVGMSTYQNWELLGTIPQPEHKRRLCEVLKASLEDLGFFPGHNNSTSGIITLKDASYDSEGMNAFLQGNLDQRLLGIVEAGTYADQRKEFALIIERFDAMNLENPDYQITRRQAVRNLAVFPFVPPINLEKRDRVSPSHYELFLKECGASLTACGELAKSSDPDDFTLAFQCVCRYLVELEVISNASSRYRTQALELAAHYAIKKKNLGWRCASYAANILFAEDAVRIARESGNICLLLSAYDKQACMYMEHQRKLALDIATIARNLLEEQKAPLPACIRGGIYSTLAKVQARNGLNPDTALKKASEQDPGEEDPYSMLYTRLWVPMDTGKTLYYAGKPVKALEAYEQLVDPNTLEVRKPFQDSLHETLRIKTILGMAQALMYGKARDKKKAIRYWEAAVEGSNRMKHESLSSQALTVYDEMKLAFQGEPDVSDLQGHTE